MTELTDDELLIIWRFNFAKTNKQRFLDIARAAIAADRDLTATLDEPADAPAAGAEEWNHASWDDLAELFSRHCCEVGDEGVGIVAKDVPAFARAVLARWGQPPASPAEGEVAELVAWLHGQDGGLGRRAIYARVAELLERHAAPVPVPVADRLPGPEDCDAEERCWLLAPRWILPSCEMTHWLPAHALPLPAPQGGEVES